MPWSAVRSERCPARTHRDLHPEPCTLHPIPCALHPKPCTLHPVPCALHPTPYTLHPTTYTLHPTPYTLHPTCAGTYRGRCFHKEVMNAGFDMRRFGSSLLKMSTSFVSLPIFTCHQSLDLRRSTVQSREVVPGRARIQGS